MFSLIKLFLQLTLAQYTINPGVDYLILFTIPCPFKYVWIWSLRHHLFFIIYWYWIVRWLRFIQFYIVSRKEYLETVFWFFNCWAWGVWNSLAYVFLGMIWIKRLIVRSMIKLARRLHTLKFINTLIINIPTFFKHWTNHRNIFWYFRIY